MNSKTGVVFGSDLTNRLQLVDGANTRRRAIAVRLVHDEHEIVEPNQVVEIALADFFRKLRIRGARPPRTSELIFEMLKMLIVVGKS